MSKDPLGNRTVPHARPARRGTPARSWIDDGILIGQVLVGIGFVFLVFYWLVDLVWGSYFGANPGFGATMSGAILLLGVAAVVILWASREVRVLTADAIDRVRDRR